MSISKKDNFGRTPKQRRLGNILGLAYGGMGASMGILTPLIFNNYFSKDLIFFLAFIPIICVWIGLWAHGRLILELDEYLRYTEVKILLFALVCSLGLATAWGYLEYFWGGLPHLPMVLVLPVFYVFYALGHGIWSRGGYNGK